MIYYLFQWLDDFGVPGARLMDYITFRSGCALVLSLFIAVIFGRKIIDRLQMMQVGEIIRDLGLEGQMKKTGTPTMGGVIIIIAILVPLSARWQHRQRIHGPDADCHIMARGAPEALTTI